MRDWWSMIMYFSNSKENLPDDSHSKRPGVDTGAFLVKNCLKMSNEIRS
jgi:hypothetical protein